MNNLDNISNLESKFELPDNLMELKQKQQVLPKREVVVDDIAEEIRDKLQDLENQKVGNVDIIPNNECSKKIIRLRAIDHINPSQPLLKRDNDLTVLRFSKKSLSNILEFLIFLSISIIVLVTIITTDLSAFENAILIMVYVMFVNFSAIAKKYLS